MTASAFRIRWLTVLAVLAVTVVLSACNGNPAPTSVPRDTPTATATAAAAAPTPVPTATAAAAPTPIPTDNGCRRPLRPPPPQRLPQPLRPSPPATAAAAPTPVPTTTAIPSAYAHRPPQLPAPTLTSAHTPTPIPASPTPEPSGAVANLDINVDSDTVWQELFDGFTASEQSCIRDALGSESLRSTLKQPVLSNADTDERDVQIFSCLGPQVAEAVFLFILVAAMEEEIETKLSEDEKSCFRESLTDTDVPALITAPDDSAVVVELRIVMLSCAPAQLLSIALGVNVELSEDEVSCLRESFTEIDAAALMAADDSALFVVFGVALLSCAPAQLLPSAVGVDVELSEDEAACLTGIVWPLSMCRPDHRPRRFRRVCGARDGDVELRSGPNLVQCVIGEDVELSEDEASCLRELVANTDAAALVAADEDSAAYVRFGAGLLVCVPDLFIIRGRGRRWRRFRRGPRQLRWGGHRRNGRAVCLGHDGLRRRLRFLSVRGEGGANFTK